MLRKFSNGTQTKPPTEDISMSSQSAPSFLHPDASCGQCVPCDRVSGADSAPRQLACSGQAVQVLLVSLPLSLAMTQRASQVLHGYDRIVTACHHWIINRSIDCNFFAQVHFHSLNSMANSECLISFTPDLHNLLESCMKNFRRHVSSLSSVGWLLVI